jgi:EAL domain-containing protein (putative c-di-GMP-specific phosphodiesterase class I)
VCDEGDAVEFRTHPLEAQRLAALRSYGVLDTPDDEAFDSLTRLAARVCQAPISLISLVDTDRQWILSRYGVDDTEDPRTQSICSDAVAAGFALVIPDLTAVSRYADLPSVVRPNGFRTYAGIPLIGREGLPLGTLCVLDTHARRFDASQLAVLHDLAEQVVLVLELRRMDAARQPPPPPAPVAPLSAERVSLRHAWRDHELVPHFQSWVDLRDGALLSVEVQARWGRPGGELLPVGTALPGSDDGELAIRTAHAMLDAAGAVLVDLRRRGIGFRDGVAVPVGVGELVRPGVARRILERFERLHLPPSALNLMISDAGPADRRSVVRRELLTLRDAGVRVTADGFGAGWHNLVHLVQLPLTGIKLDRRVISGMLRDSDQENLVLSAVNLGRAMNIRIGAQGVDSEAIREWLLLKGCPRGQGALFGEPVRAGEVPALFLGPAARTRQLQPR